MSGRARVTKRGSLLIVVLAIFTTAMLIAFVAPRVGFALICGGGVFHLRPEVPGANEGAITSYGSLKSLACSCVSIRLLLIANVRHWSWCCQARLARIFSISEAVKARMVCVWMLPSMSAASNTLGGRLIVRGLKNAHLVVLTERPIHLLNSDSHRLHLETAQAATRWVVCLAPWTPLSVNCTKLIYVGLIFSVPAVTFDLDSFVLRGA